MSSNLTMSEPIVSAMTLYNCSLASIDDNLAVILSYNPFMDSPLEHLPDSRTIVDAMSRREFGEGFN
jgi:hypothetical protein